MFLTIESFKSPKTQLIMTKRWWRMLPVKKKKYKTVPETFWASFGLGGGNKELIFDTSVLPKMKPMHLL